MNRRPKLRLIAPGVSPEEAAAIVAALERFMRETAPVLAGPAPAPSRWMLVARQEAVGREPAPAPPWG